MAGKAFFSDGGGSTWFLGLPRLNVPQRFEGRITHATSFSYVFVQNLTLQDEIAEIDRRLEEESKPDSQPLAYIAKNTLAVIRYGPRSRLWRVLVLDSKGKMANVAFVDFGNIDEVPAHRLRPLPPELATIPAQAIPLKLENAPASSDQRILFDDFQRSVIGLKALVELHDGAVKGRLKGSLKVIDRSGYSHTLEEIVSWKNTTFWNDLSGHRFNKYTVASNTASTDLQANPSQIAQNCPISSDLYAVTHIAYLFIIAVILGAIALLYGKNKKRKQSRISSHPLIDFDNTAHEDSV